MVQAIELSSDPVGVIEEIHGPVIDVVCERLPPLHQALFCMVDHQNYIFEVHRHLDARRVRAIALHSTGGLRRGLTVFDSGGPLRIPVTPDCLNRMLDMFGAPLDGEAPLQTSEMRNIIALPALLTDTVPAEGILESGIKVIDLLCPFVAVKDGHWWCWCWKTVLIMNYNATSICTKVSVFAGVGERIREERIGMKCKMPA